MKKTRSQVVQNSAADRKLRDAIRKCFPLLLQTLMATDPTHTGFIKADLLHNILLKMCIPMTFQDFRYVIENIQKSDNDSLVNIHNFLETYNPKTAPHALVKFVAPTDPIGSPVLMRSSMSERPLSESTGKETNMFSSMNSSMNKSNSKKTLSINEDMRKVDPSGELRRIWQGVLRECHRHDPDRTGCVSRLAFIRSVESANNNKGQMSPESMSKLADKYDAGYGLVNYLACFRMYLTGMTANAIIPEKKKDLGIEGGWSLTESRNIKALHPWEFDYARDKATPYWSVATGMPKDPKEMKKQEIKIPSAQERSANQLSESEQKALLGKYNDKVLITCAKIYHIVGGGVKWRDLRNEMKTSQINSQRGCILTVKFYALMEKYDIKLSINATGAVVRAFRGLGNQDVIKYNDLVRVCTLAYQVGTK